MEIRMGLPNKMIQFKQNKNLIKNKKKKRNKWMMMIMITIYTIHRLRLKNKTDS